MMEAPVTTGAPSPRSESNSPRNAGSGTKRAAFQKRKGITFTTRSGSVGRVAPPLREPLDLQSQLEQKADTKDLWTLNDIKSNKVDTEQAMRGIDILHLQITHILVLLIELGKTIVNQQKESQVSIQNKRLFMLE